MHACAGGGALGARRELCGRDGPPARRRPAAALAAAAGPRPAPCVRRNPPLVAENDGNLLFEGADSAVRAALGSSLLRFAWSAGRREIRLPDGSPRDGRLSSKPATRSRFRCRTAYDAHRRAQAFEPIRLPSGWMPASWRRIDRNCGNGGSTVESRFRSIVRQKMGGVSGRFRLPGAGCGPRAAPSPQAGGAGYEFSTIGARLGKVCYTPCWKR